MHAMLLHGMFCELAEGNFHVDVHRIVKICGVAVTTTQVLFGTGLPLDRNLWGYSIQINSDFNRG